MKPKAPGAFCEKCPLQDAPFVPPYGPKHPAFIVVGEGPGREEVKAGQPFVGRSGKLLREVLLAADLDPNTGYFTNVVLCHPPDNRKPETEEVSCCAPRLAKELAAIPEAPILAVGGAASESLVGEGVTSARGAWYDFNGRDVLVTFHPAYVLREPNMGVDIIKDVKKFTDGRHDWPISLEHPPKWEVLDTPGKMSVLLQHNRWFVWDFETNQVDWTRNAALLLGIAFSPTRAYIIPDEMLYDCPEAIEILNYLFQNNYPIAHNGKFDIMFARKLGIDKAWVKFDTLLAHYTLDERKYGHGLKKLLHEYFDLPDYEGNLVQKHLKSRNDDYSKVPFDDLALYCAFDVCATYALKFRLESELKEQGLLERPFKETIMVAHELAVEMEWLGMQVDVEHLQYWREQLVAEQEEYLRQCREISGHPELNPRSALQVARVVWDERQLPHPPKQTWDKIKGQVNVNPRSTSEVALFHLANVKGGEVESFDDPFLDVLFKYRRVSKILSTYVDKILGRVDENSRFHDDIKVFGTETGRLATFLHTIPRETTDIYGRITKSAFIATPGYKYVRADFSQAELRSAGALSKDEFIIRVYDEGRDLHTEVCIAVFGIDWNKEQRIIIKRYNFAYIYGGGYSALVSDTNIPKDQAHRIMKEYDAQMIGLSTWKKSQQAFMLENGYVESPFGRRRRFPYMNDKNREEALKSAINAPVQSTAADVTTHSAREAVREGYRVLLTKHDELIVEVPEADAEMHAARIKAIMEETGARFLPEVKWVADYSLKDRWAEPPTRLS